MGDLIKLKRELKVCPQGGWVTFSDLRCLISFGSKVGQVICPHQHLMKVFFIPKSCVNVTAAWPVMVIIS